MGYYAYLPTIFIYNDYHYSYTNELKGKYEKTGFIDGFLINTDQGKVNKYFIGVSILWLPFFLTAHFLAHLFGLPADGYSIIYQIAVLIAANIYLWLGCRFTRKIILEYTISQNVAAFILLLTVFGSNLFYYVVVDSSHSHIYSFAVIAVFLFYVQRFFKTKENKDLYLMAFLFGLIVLCRPTNIVIGLMIFFFAGNIKTFWNSFFKYQIIVAAIVFFLTIVLQPLMYYLQTGHFMVWSYGEERFYFDNPQFRNILISYEKGLFVYTPLVLIASFGTIYIFKKNKFQFIVLSLFLFLATYIISCWWCWWYGGSLGQRAFVDYYAVLALLLTFVYLGFERKTYKKLFLIITPVFILHMMILMHQMRYSIIDNGGMNEKRFWFTFLKTGEDYYGLVYAKELFSGPEPANIVWMKAFNDKYICTSRNESQSLEATSDKASLWETFNIIELENGKIVIKTDEGTYISTRLEKGNQLLHSVNKIGGWEVYDLINVGNGKSVLRACNNKYVALANNALVANTDNIDKAERISIIKK
jgi:hypothetical protein